MLLVLRRGHRYHYACFLTGAAKLRIGGNIFLYVVIRHPHWSIGDEKAETVTCLFWMIIYISIRLYALVMYTVWMMIPNISFQSAADFFFHFIKKIAIKNIVFIYIIFNEVFIRTSLDNIKIICKQNVNVSNSTVFE